MNSIEQQISEYISAVLAIDPVQAYSIENLYKEGLDSFSFIELISDLERRYDVHFSDDELMSDGFRNIPSISELINKKKS